MQKNKSRPGCWHSGDGNRGKHINHSIHPGGGKRQVLVGELLQTASKLPPDAHISVYVDQDMELSSDDWSARIEAHLSDYFEVAELVAETEWDGPRQAPCLTIVTGKAVV